MKKAAPAFDRNRIATALRTLRIDLRHHDAQEAIYRGHATLERLLAAHNEPAPDPPMVPIADVLTDHRACETLEAMGVYLIGHLAEKTYAELLDGVLIGHGTLNFLQMELRKNGMDFKPPS